MWCWQSQALAGALSFGGSVPDEYLTCWAVVGVALAPKMHAPASAESPHNTPRRSQPIPCIVSSRLLVVHIPGFGWGLRARWRSWAFLATRCSGLVPTPWQSGSIDHEQGVCAPQRSSTMAPRSAGSGSKPPFVQAVRPTWALLGLGGPTFLSTATRAW